jgi:hypothetical protein
MGAARRAMGIAMQYDRQDRGDNRASYIDEIEIMARAQRLRGQYVGDWLRRHFGGAKKVDPAAATSDFARGGGLRPQRS